MNQVQQITEGIYWIGANDDHSAFFENYIPIPEGVTYNSYFIDDEKTAVIDTTDRIISEQFLDNVEYLLAGRPLDYIIVNHMEPDHSSTLLMLAEKYPSAKIAGSAPALRMFEQFFHRPMKDRYIVTNDRVTLSLGRRTLRFFTAPMVHWPEVTFTYDETDQILFSADAFGTFGRIGGSIFADDCDYKKDYTDSARRYYSSIVSKYGPQVLGAMRKISSVPMKVLASLHGPVFRTEADIAYVMNEVRRWAGWEPSVRGAVIFYTSTYGNTAAAAERLALDLKQKGVSSVKLMDMNHTDVSYGLAAAMEYSHLVFAAPAYNMGLFPKMRTFLEELGDHLIKGRKVALVGNSSWAPSVAEKIMKEMISSWKDTEFLGDPVHIQSSVGDAEAKAIETLAETVAASIHEGGPQADKE